MPRRFLIVRIAALGDVVHCSALLNRLVAEHPDAHISWLCSDSAAGLVRLFPGVDEVLTVDERHLFRGTVLERFAALAKTWRQLLARRFDQVLLAHADYRYRLLTLPLLGTRVAMLSHGANPLRGRFRADEYARLADRPGSRGPLVRTYPLADVRPNLPAAQRTRPAAVVLVPGGTRNILRSDVLRRWPAEYYRELALRLTAAGREVVLVGDAGDENMLPNFEGVPVTNFIGKLSIPETLCVMRDANVVVSHDTGPLHFARLVRSPIVALFGPTDPREFVGEDNSIVTLWGGARLACRPCYDGRDYAECTNNLCMRDISVEVVLGAVLARTNKANA